MEDHEKIWNTIKDEIKQLAKNATKEKNVKEKLTNHFTNKYYIEECNKKLREKIHDSICEHFNICAEHFEETLMNEGVLTRRELEKLKAAIESYDRQDTKPDGNYLSNEDVSAPRDIIAGVAGGSAAAVAGGAVAIAIPDVTIAGFLIGSVASTVVGAVFLLPIAVAAIVWGAIVGHKKLQQNKMDDTQKHLNSSKEENAKKVVDFIDKNRLREKLWKQMHLWTEAIIKGDESEIVCVIEEFQKRFRTIVDNCQTCLEKADQIRKANLDASC